MSYDVDIYEIINNMEVIYENKDGIQIKKSEKDDETTRYVKCSICKKRFKRTIVRHLRNDHEEWKLFLDIMIEETNKGKRPMKIQIETFNSLFSWNVIQREMRKMKNISPERFQLKEIDKNYLEPVEDDDPDPTNSIWRFTKRGKWAGHNSHYQGNWPPQVPRILIKRYSNEGDLVIDPFLGGGTTMVEALLLKRKFKGSDISNWAINSSRRYLQKLKKLDNRFDVKVENIIKESDVREIKYVKKEEVDLICTHPPYYNIKKYSKNENDLSNISDLEIFLTHFQEAVLKFYEVLKPGGYFCFMIGDVRKNGRIIPLNYHAQNFSIQAGFEPIEIIIKEQFNATVKKYYSSDDIQTRITHEYIYVYMKPKSKT